MTLAHSALYVQLHRAGVPESLAKQAAAIVQHKDIPPGLIDILAAVVAAVNVRTERLEQHLLELKAEVARQGREIEGLRQELEALRRARPPVDAVSRQELR